MAVNGKVKESKESKVSFFTRTYRGLKAEMTRITWPTKEETKKAIAAVVTFCVIYTVVVGIMDYGFNNLFKLIFK